MFGTMDCANGQEEISRIAWSADGSAYATRVSTNTRDKKGKLEWVWHVNLVQNGEVKKVADGLQNLAFLGNRLVTGTSSGKQPNTLTIFDQKGANPVTSQVEMFFGDIQTSRKHIFLSLLG